MGAPGGLAAGFLPACLISGAAQSLLADPRELSWQY